MKETEFQRDILVPVKITARQFSAFGEETRILIDGANNLPILVDSLPDDLIKELYADARKELSYVNSVSESI